VHADLAAFVTVLARDVARGQIDPKRLSEALRLGSLRRSLLDEPDATDDQSAVGGDVSIF
jgi:hypothetical protein